MDDRPLHVLVVDNDPGEWRQISGWLSAAGHTCTSVPDAHTAVQVARAELPDIALVDLGVARTVGGALAQCLRDQLAPARLVMLSGSGAFAPEVAARLEVDDWLVKPLARGELLTAVEWFHGTAAARCPQDREVSGLMGLLKARSPGEFGHARRVRASALAIGHEMGLGQRMLAEVGRGAALHDIGMLTLPHAVLSGHGPLSVAEQALLTTVPLSGFRLAESLPGLQAAARIVLCARERFDGAGYPFGLEGDAIPIGSRIVAVAHACDGRSAWEVNSLADHRVDVSAEIASEAGTRFDPDVVAAWFRVAERQFKSACTVPM